MGLNFKEAVLVEDEVQQFMNIINLTRVFRDEIDQFLRTPGRVVCWVDPGGHFPNILWHIAEEPLDHRERFGFGFSQVLNDAAGVDLNLFVAEFFLGDVRAQRRLDHRGAADKHLADVLDHNVEMAQRRVDGGQPCDGP